MDGMLHNTGGNTLLAAIHLCDRVDVYGAGLFSRGPASPKMYVHNYDPKVQTQVTCVGCWEKLRPAELKHGRSVRVGGEDTKVPQPTLRGIPPWTEHRRR